MASLVNRFLNKSKATANKTSDASSSSTIEEIIIEDDESSERPYIINSIYYLAVILFIGMPMWFYTCSSTRYALPDLTRLEDRVVNNAQQLRLHLDISVVQLSASTKHHHDQAKEKQADYLRVTLPEYLNTSTDGLVYTLNWRIRRPTQEENQLLKSILKDNDNPPATIEQRQEIFEKLEKNLLKIHKPSNRFRLFMYLFEEPLNSLVCNSPHSYLINFERFLYLCPGDGDESLANLIKSALHETYFESVDPQRIRKILSAKTDLLVSLVPENGLISQGNLSVLADKVHKIHEKNIKSKYLELPGILNIKLITQNLADLLQNNALDKMVKSSSFQTKGQERSAESSSNATDGLQTDTLRIASTKDMGQFFHDYETRLNKHSSQSVHHAVTIVPDQSKPPLIFEQASQEGIGAGESRVNILEERDTNFILIADSDKSLVLGLRAIVRRIIGLKSANLCKNCLIKRDVFINRWELDAIVGALTILKLQNVLISLRSISQQAIGIKIPKYVSSMVFEAHSLALKSIDNLDTKKSLEAYHSVNSAYELAEAAFYDPSLLETLYFPDETKYAIYLPFFLPLAFPIAMSILRLIKHLLTTSSFYTRKRAETKEKQQ